MIVTFGEQPPVYAKSKIEIQQSTSTPYPVQRKQALLIEINSIFSISFILIYTLINILIESNWYYFISFL